ncbi:PLC-like phosphodiesterase [Paraphoma chrysanthemicola]|uniref:PLC-like phosphodiesterase n=1 Tax=Paraphoma chrysanthemicola TaxID=798071 RepID=A0A8K0RE73_9PLEO|nr:PLC-like phosphodiesterase [Paraphoma chrysanthemicola]
MFSRSWVQVAAIIPFLFSTATAQTACNNSPSLCSKAYNNITHLGAHNSPFLRNQQTSFSTSGNHFYNTTVQLDAGVRLLTAQVHKANDTTGSQSWHLCHSSCDLLDAGTLESWLTEIKTWMDRNTNDIVTILLVNSDNASPSDLGSQFSASGIDTLAYAPPSLTTIPQTWPTLETLISNGTRLMTFVASLPTPSTQFPYLMDEFTFIFENNFENVNPSNYSCTPNRPSTLGTAAAALSSGRMFLMNHFLYETQLFGIQSPNTSYAGTTNAQTGFGSLGVSVQECTTVYGKPPTFVLVDWFNMGPAIASVDAANGVTGATGRKSVSTAPLTQESTGGVGRREGSLVAVVVALVVAVAFGA